MTIKKMVNVPVAAATRRIIRAREPTGAAQVCPVIGWRGEVN